MVPTSAGAFHLDDYVAYIEEFIRHIGAERVHVISVRVGVLAMRMVVGAVRRRRAGVDGDELAGGPQRQLVPDPLQQRRDRLVVGDAAPIPREPPVTIARLPANSEGSETGILNIWWFSLQF